MSESIKISRTAEVLGEHNTCSNSNEEEDGDGDGEEIKSDKWEPSDVPTTTWHLAKLPVGSWHS